MLGVVVVIVVLCCFNEEGVIWYGCVCLCECVRACVCVFWGPMMLLSLIYPIGSVYVQLFSFLRDIIEN